MHTFVPDPTDMDPLHFMYRPEANNAKVAEYPVSDNSTPAIVKCFCERPVHIATANTDANRGRQFELCATNQCKYWEWRDKEGIAGTRCACTRIIRILTAGRGAMAHNRGRDFARCAHPENDRRCRFFKWLDGQDSQAVFREYMDARMNVV
ncbi:hypothetical protein FB451DRAFT_1176294 [Mycena latifolia]|nr:hypothetical protein FB451DRAFT_1176294 [Mycena latifolia]